MASKEFHKEVAKLKKEDLVASIKEMMDEEFKVVPRKDYAATYALEHNRRASDTDDTFARVAHNKNTAMLPKMKKKDLEDLYVAYLEIREAGYLGPTSGADPVLPKSAATAAPEGAEK